MKLKPIPGYNGYFISRRGKLWSNRFMGYPGQFKALKPYIDRHGRPRVTIRDQFGLPKIIRISQLVALTYIPNPHNYPLVMHLDNDVANNWYKNLAWGTQAMNIAQMVKDGRARFGGYDFTYLGSNK